MLSRQNLTVGQNENWTNPLGAFYFIHDMTWIRHDTKLESKCTSDYRNSNIRDKLKGKSRQVIVSGSHEWSVFSFQVFDVTRKITYKNLPSWYEELREFRPEIPCLCAANKIDSTYATHVVHCNQATRSYATAFHGMFNIHKVYIYLPLWISEFAGFEKSF